MAGFVFLHLSLPFSPLHSNFWALYEPSLRSSRLKTAAIRWQLWAFHLSAISRRNESSVCLSKPFSVFNLKCFSGSLSVAHPAALASSRPGWIPQDVRGFDERRVRSDLAAIAAFKSFQVFKRTQRLHGAECFRQISHLWIHSFSTAPTWGESLREILRFRERNEIGITGCQTEHFLCSHPTFVFVFLWVFEVAFDKLSQTCLTLFISLGWMLSRLQSWLQCFSVSSVFLSLPPVSGSLWARLHSPVRLALRLTCC